MKLPKITNIGRTIVFQETLPQDIERIIQQCVDETIEIDYNAIYDAQAIAMSAIEETIDKGYLKYADGVWMQVLECFKEQK